MRKMALHWKIIIGLVLGVVWAFLSSAMGWRDFTIDWIKPWGTIFINLLKLIAVPLVLFSIIKGIIDLKDISKIRRVGLKTLGIYVATTVIAIVVGLTLANVIQPGRIIGEEQLQANHEQFLIFKAADDMAAADGTPRELSDLEKKVQQADATKDKGPLQIIVEIVPDNIFSSFMDITKMLQVIFFAILFGAVLSMIDPEKAIPMVQFIESGNEIFLKMVDVVMQAAPFFVFALMAGNMAELADSLPALLNLFKGLGLYAVTVIAGLAFSLFITYPSILRTFTRQIPYLDFFRGIGSAQALAFSTSSSAATLPATMDCVTENLGVSKRIASFTLPLGATINMDGTSLYQAVSVLFLAQMHMVDLTLADQLTIVVMATLISIGTAPVPGVGLIMLIIVLESVGLNPMWVAIILPVDRIIDMIRTMVNISGDAAVTVAVASTEGELDYAPKNKIDNFDI